LKPAAEAAHKEFILYYHQLQAYHSGCSILLSSQ